MDSAKLNMYMGLLIGLVAGGGLTILVMKVKGFFGGSELKELKRENRELKERLEKKDRYIEEMLSHAQHLAENIGTMKSSKGESSDSEG